jgi:hypothetical protein
MKQEFYDGVAFRKKIYENVGELQKNIDKWLKYYN